MRITSLDQNLNKKHECATDPEEKKKTAPEEKQEKSGKLSKRTRNKIGETGIKAPEENINIGYIFYPLFLLLINLLTYL